MEDEARETVLLRRNFKEGPLYTGNDGQEGKIVYEIEGSTGDGIKRFTDKYIWKRRIGNDKTTFPFTPEHFPLELQKFIGTTSANGTSNGHTTSVNNSADKVLDVEAAARAAEGTSTRPGDKADEAENASGGEDEQDEFEEFDDDDYNAEKYFDDGDDDDMNGDDGGDEAAY